jgi:hypothetical protein
MVVVGSIKISLVTTNANDGIYQLYKLANTKHDNLMLANKLLKSEHQLSGGRVKQKKI